MDDLIGEFLHVRVLADDLHEAPHIVPGPVTVLTSFSSPRIFSTRAAFSSS